MLTGGILASVTLATFILRVLGTHTHPTHTTQSIEGYWSVVEGNLSVSRFYRESETAAHPRAPRE